MILYDSLRDEILRTPLPTPILLKVWLLLDFYSQVARHLCFIPSSDDYEFLEDPERLLSELLYKLMGKMTD